MAVQKEYNLTAAKAIDGLLADTGDFHVVSDSAVEAIPYGSGLVRMSGVESGVRLPNMNVATVTLSGPLIASNVFTVTINGVDVAVTYATSHNNTMGLMVTALEALPYIDSCSFTGNILSIHAIDNFRFSSVVGVVTLGATQATASTTYNTSDVIAGISISSDTKAIGGPGNSVYDQATLTLAGDALNTSDVVTVSLNGTVLTTVTYATSEAATLQKVAGVIKAAPGVASAMVNSRVITVSMNQGLSIVIQATVADNALASVAPKFTTAYTKQTSAFGEEDVFYAAGQTVNVLEKGRVWVKVENAVTRGDSVYCRYKAGSAIGETIGRFRNDADSGTCFATGLVFSKGAAAGDFAIININQP